MYWNKTKQTLLSGTGKIILLVHSLSNKKTSSQICIILWFSWPSQYIINIFLHHLHFLNKETRHRIKKTLKNMFFIEKIKHVKYVLNNYAKNVSFYSSQLLHLSNLVCLQITMIVYERWLLTTTPQTTVNICTRLALLTSLTVLASLSFFLCHNAQQYCIRILLLEFWCSLQ